MYWSDRISALPGGAPVPAGTLVTAKLTKDGSTVATATTDADGYVEFIGNGSPGRMYLEVTVGGETRRIDGSVSGQVLDYFQAELPAALGGYTDGYFPDVSLGDGSVTPGSGLSVVVAGGAFLAHGIVGTFYDPTTLTIAPNATGSTRIDRVVYRATLTGDDQGKTEVAVKTGTAVAPALQQDATVWEIGLADIAVPNGAGALVSGNITDTRAGVTTPIADGSITAAKLADNAVSTTKIVDSAVTGTKLASNAVSTAKVADSAVTSAKLASGAVTTAKIADGSVTSAKLAAGAAVLTTGEGKSTGTISAGQLVDTRTIVMDDVAFGAAPIGAFIQYFYPNFGNTAGRIAEGNHQHNASLLNIWDFSATGQLPTSGTRTLSSQSSFTAQAGISYNSIAIACVRAKNDINLGTIQLGIKIGGQATKTRNVDTVGGVPVDNLIVDARSFTGDGNPLLITATVSHVVNDPSNIQNGWVCFLAWPRS